MRELLITYKAPFTQDESGTQEYLPGHIWIFWCLYRIRFPWPSLMCCRRMEIQTGLKRRICCVKSRERRLFSGWTNLVFSLETRCSSSLFGLIEIRIHFPRSIKGKLVVTGKAMFPQVSVILSTLRGSLRCYFLSGYQITCYLQGVFVQRGNLCLGWWRPLDEDLDVHPRHIDPYPSGT